jgi:Fic family protein
MRANLLSRLSQQHLQDFLSRRLSTKEIAKLYEVKPAYAVRTLPKRPAKESLNKALLKETRTEYRLMLAEQVDSGRLTIKEMAAIAHCSLATAFRMLRKYRARP